MTHAERVTEGLQLLARKAVCQASHVAWVQKLTGCTDDTADEMLQKRLSSDLIPWNAAAMREMTEADVQKVLRPKK